MIKALMFLMKNVEFGFRLLNSEIGNDLSSTSKKEKQFKSVFVSLTRR